MDDIRPVDQARPDRRQTPDLLPDGPSGPGIKVVSDKVVYANNPGPNPLGMAWDGTRFATFGVTLSSKPVLYSFDKGGKPFSARTVLNSSIGGATLVVGKGRYGAAIYNKPQNYDRSFVTIPITGGTIDLSKGTVVTKNGGLVRPAWASSVSRYLVLIPDTSWKPDPALLLKTFDASGKPAGKQVVLDSSSKDFVSAIFDHVWVGGTLAVSGLGKKKGAITDRSTYLRVIPPPYTKTKLIFDMLPPGYHQGSSMWTHPIATDGKVVFTAWMGQKGTTVTLASLTGKIAPKPAVVSTAPRYRGCPPVAVHAHGGYFLVLCYTVGSLPELLTLFAFDGALKRVLGPVDFPTSKFVEPSARLVSDGSDLLLVYLVKIASGNYDLRLMRFHIVGLP